jgi:hypothetical protein
MEKLALLYRAAEKFTELQELYNLLKPHLNNFQEDWPAIRKKGKVVLHHIFPEIFKEEIETAKLIAQMQIDLNGLGYPIRIDGELGNETFSAFQQLLIDQEKGK